MWYTGINNCIRRLNLKTPLTISIISGVITAFMFVCYLTMLIEGQDQEAFAFLFAVVLFGLIPIAIYLEGDKNGKNNAETENREHH